MTWMISGFFLSYSSLCPEGRLHNLHLASFSFAKGASIRGPAEHDTVRLLLDEMLLDGFVTQGEPLLVTQPAELLAELTEALAVQDFEKV